MKSIYDLVYELLRDYPALRDSDKKLIWSVWIREGKVVGGKISMEDFLKASVEESITRARRKVQEEHPELAASPIVEAMRKEKEEEKGTHIYRENVDVAEPLTMDYTAKMTMLMKAKEELIKKGILKRRGGDIHA